MADGVVKILAQLDSKKLDSDLKNLGKGASGIAKGIAAGFAASTAAVAKLTQQSFEAYGQYEQMVGGIEALYKGSSQAVIDYAQNAYKTSQFSANQYMELATTFSASLIKDLNGDTQKAADITNMAVNAISDNWSVMGGDIELIKKAYQGFARNSYVMLDNLKLGYAGTKGEMKRLVADANEYAKSIGEAGNLTMDSFADQIKAIDLIQRKLGMAGNAQREAAHTIQGSLQMTKAAWQNLLVGLSDKDADLNKLIDQFVDSFDTLAENSIPVLEHALDAISNTIDKLAPKIADRLPGIIERVAPKLVGAAIKIGGAVIKSLPSILDAITKAASKDIGASFGILSGVLAMNANKVFKAGKGVFDFGKAVRDVGIKIKEAGSIATAFPKLFNPVGLAIAGVTAAVVVGAIAIKNYYEYMHPVSEAAKKNRDAMEKERQSMQALTDQRKEAMAKVAESTAISNSLYGELVKLVDVNGRVREGDKEYAQHILTQLNETLGTHMTLVDGKIVKDGQAVDVQNELKNIIDETTKAIERQTLAESFAGEYNEALKQKAALQQRDLELKADLKDKQEELNKAERELEQVQGTFGVSTEVVSVYMREVERAKNALGETQSQVNQLSEAQRENNKILETGANLYSGNADRINQAILDIESGVVHLSNTSDQEFKEFLDTTTKMMEGLHQSFLETGQIDEEALKSLSNSWNQVLEEAELRGQDLQAIYSNMSDEQLAIIAQMDLKGALSGKAKEAFEAYKTETGLGFDENGNIIRDKGAENAQDAENAGRSTADSEAQGLRSGEGNVAGAAEEVAEAAKGVKPSNEETSSWGWDFVNSFASAIRSGIDTVKGAAHNVAEAISSVLGFSRPDEGPLRWYDRWPVHFLQGYAAKIRENKHLVTDEVDLMASDIAAALAEINSDFVMADLAADIRTGAKSITAAMNINGEKAQMMLASGQPFANAQGPTLNFYDTQTSPEAIYQKMQQASTYGFARSYT